MSLSYQHIKKKIWSNLSEVVDPEIPVINIVELGVIRNVEIKEGEITITITPTYSGCPAMETFEKDIKSKLSQRGFKQIKIATTFSPAWTTDWLSSETKDKLKKYGIAPPQKSLGGKKELFKTESKVVECPFCNSKDTKLVSQFGSTACKALHFCNSCSQPFEYFKCI
jgi:ring-1,2-phenylacetyl-CoA epoxidase subunit PaaD